MVEVIKVFVQFMNHLTIYAVETSSAEAPRGRLSALVSLVGGVSQQGAAVGPRCV